MSEAWTSQPEAERVLALATDSRPAWLWSGDGAGPIWHNHAASLFGARIKNDSLRRAESPTPVKGQIGRILRLGLTGRPMLSRMQFIAGRKPLSATCICTPLKLGEDKSGLLVVGADPIDDEVLKLDPIGVEAPPLPAEPDGPAEPEADVAIDDDVTPQSLGDLVDRLAGDARLFAPLAEDEDPVDQDEPVAPPPARWRRDQRCRAIGGNGAHRLIERFGPDTGKHSVSVV
jgi:hypothetical protein